MGGLNTKLQLYLKKILASGGPVTARSAIAAARGLLLAYSRHKLVECGGSIDLNKHWASSLFKTMDFSML